MATLVAVVGAGISTALGFGPQVGWIIGSIVGGLAFPPPGTESTAEGPRLGDLSITSSTYGASIPITFGTIRMAGNMIWSLGIEEVKNVKKEQSGGGKGGGGGNTATTTTYEYFSTFAIAFGEGEAKGVLRMWADGKLIYDLTNSGDDISKVNLRFRFYPGSETQEPDGLIEADKGVGNTPAFRGLAYIVFDRLPLLDFGNRVPSITIEISYEFAAAQPSTDMDFFTTAEGGEAGDVSQGDTLLPDYDRGLLYWVTSSATPANNFLRRADLRTMTENRQSMISVDATAPTPNDVTFLDMLAVTRQGFIVVVDGSSNSRPISVIDPESMLIINTFGQNGVSTTNSFGGFAATVNGRTSVIELAGLNGPEYFLFTGSVFASVGLVNVTDGRADYLWDSDARPGQPNPSMGSNPRVKGTCAGAIGDNFGEGYAIGGSSFGSPSALDVNFYKITVNANALFDAVANSFSGVVFLHLAAFTPGELIAGETLLKNVKGPIYDPADDTFMFEVTADSDDQDYMLKMDPETGLILWTTAIPFGRNSTSGLPETRVQNGVFAAISGGTSYALRTATGELFDQQSGWSPQHITTGAQFWDGRTSNIIGQSDNGFTKWNLFRGAGGPASLDTIVRDLNVRAGLEAADIDVTPLSTEIVPGYTIARQSTVRGSIQPLASAYYFDGVESDYILKYILRDGKTTAVTIPQVNLALLSGNSSEFFQENRVQEVELPSRFTITYMDKDNDYQQAAHNAKRILGPSASMSSRNEMGLVIAAALSSDFAKQAAEKALYSSWIERANYAIRLPWTYLALDPSDLVDVSLDNGTLFHTRFVAVDIGIGFIMEVAALSEDAAQYTSVVASSGGDSGLVNEFLSVSVTKVILLCSPLLRDSDDVGRSSSVLYYFMGGLGQPGWTAGTLFKSPEGSEYSPVGSTVEEMTYGSAGSVLGDVADPFSTDEVNTLRVFMVTGAAQLASVTQLEMVNGANPAALIHANGIDVEIIQFRDVVVNGDGSRTLSGLLRGRRGTDVFTANHALGNTFVLLTPTSGDTLPLSLGERDQTRFYRGVTTGSLFEDADILPKASPLNDLKPYAVVAQKASPSGNDIVFAWVRRTRVGGALQDDIGDVPLSEDTEAYEIDILDAPAGSIVRTVVGLSTPAFTYLEADQNTDGFTPPQSTITVTIYQISAQVGRGFAEEITLNVQ